MEDLMRSTHYAEPRSRTRLDPGVARRAPW